MFDMVFSAKAISRMPNADECSVGYGPTSAMEAGFKGWCTVSQGESIKETSSNNTYGLREGKRAAYAKTAAVSSKPKEIRTHQI